MAESKWAGLPCFVILCLCGPTEGMRCKQCQDIDDPRHCRTYIDCGTGEFCSTEEFVDVDGLTAYRLGCANAMNCKIFTEAKTIFGKRDLAAKCYQCCEKDNCNSNLCLSHVTTPSPTTATSGMRCKQCQDIDDPRHCRTYIDCGTGEVCSTEEFTDVNGLPAYRLGCANANRCKLITEARTIFGKRDLSTQCYQCCEKDDCNANLCQSHVTTPAPTSSVTLINTTSGCPEYFIPFKDQCYLVLPGLANWTNAESICRQHGSYLVSINSKEEHDFLKGVTTWLNVAEFDSYWTGGYFSPKIDAFEWVDKSPFNYTDWFPAYPKSPGASTMLYIAVTNPVHTNQYYENFLMYDYLDNNQWGIICETSKI